MPGGSLPPIQAALRAQARVVAAVMLRNVRTRFFGHGLGYLISIAWPLAHILVLLALYSFADRAAPYGESLVLFFATGLLPFMAFSYMGRWMILSVLQNRPLLVFPAVRIVDLLVAGALLELLSACGMAIVLMIVLAILGVDFMPFDTVQAMSAFGAALLLGFGTGFVCSVLAMIMPGWFTGYMLATIALYLTSGILVPTDALPEHIREWLAYNPCVQIVEWMRSAYYEGYGSTLDRPYVVAWGGATLLLGLLLERGMRGRLLVGR